MCIRDRVAAEGSLDDGLRGNIGAQAHIREHADAFDIVLRDGFVAA